MRSFLMNGSSPFAITAPDFVATRVLSASTAESQTVPDGAEYMEIITTLLTYITYIDDGEDTDLVTNGAFASDTGWTKGTGWTIAAGVASSDGSQAAPSLLQQASALIEGKAYKVTFTVSAFTSGNVRPVMGGTNGTNRASAATFSETIIAGAGGVLALEADADFVGSVDNLIVAPVAHIPVADQSEGYASEQIPPGVKIMRRVATVNAISLIAAGTPVVTMAFWGK